MKGGGGGVSKGEQNFLNVNIYNFAMDDKGLGAKTFIHNFFFFFLLKPTLIVFDGCELTRQLTGQPHPSVQYLAFSITKNYNIEI